MAVILSIETSTTVCSIAIARDGKLLSLHEVNAGFSHSENLTVFIQKASEEAGIKLNELDAIAVSKGPGSYTGLRIGVSTAKGLCYALKKPLIAIPTLQSLAGCYLASNVLPLNSNILALDSKVITPGYNVLAPGSIVLLPMLDARRMEVYCALFDSSLNEISPAEAVVVNENSFVEMLKSHRVVFFGDGYSKCKPLFESNLNAVFAEVNLSATGMISLAEAKFTGEEFEDVSLFEPFYLKEAAIG
ncbi:MAG: tRNA (adenosine(37)-N6)-threonylcarbamoyltransferase complex dimerization subunit type 1 TsaB [Bacteroidetes bacterium]|nr:tRNA (adenosine(37)-N6)-threonylcarbamoyltransferase complex dimerization subunit type 1 TsaB [Bacteroidota bacterium]